MRCECFNCGGSVVRNEIRLMRLETLEVVSMYPGTCKA